eukprot:9880343-Karenia_brevis.AAC.1
MCIRDSDDDDDEDADDDDDEEDDDDDSLCLDLLVDFEAGHCCGPVSARHSRCHLGPWSNVTM